MRTTEEQIAYEEGRRDGEADASRSYATEKEQEYEYGWLDGHDEGYAQAEFEQQLLIEELEAQIEELKND
jgi:flagellar biosynthesis/type III secretory pathway protein FliH